MFNWLKRLVCSHPRQRFVRNIYGDEIIACGYRRSIWRCEDCGTELFREHLEPAKREYDNEVVWLDEDENKQQLAHMLLRAMQDTKIPERTKSLWSPIELWQKDGMIFRYDSIRDVVSACFVARDSTDEEHAVSFALNGGVLHRISTRDLEDALQAICQAVVDHFDAYAAPADAGGHFPAPVEPIFKDNYKNVVGFRVRDQVQYLPTYVKFKDS